MTELVDADIPRVDLVDKAANGRKWLLTKGEGETPNLLTTDYVAALIKEAKDDMARPNDEVVKDDPNLDAGGDPLESSGDPLENQPSSAEWEQVDADTAMRWVAILARAKNALLLLAEREAIEATSGDDDDIENAWDLEDAASTIDYIIDTLAGYAAGEQSEVDLAGLEKALDELVAAEPSVAAVEGIAPLTKAGRVLSAANETALRSAVDSILKVLGSLPAEPVVEEPVVEKVEAPVLDLSDPAPMPAQKAAPPSRFSAAARAARAEAAVKAAEPVAPAVPAVKADEEPAADGEKKLLAVFDGNKNMIGVIDPADLQQVDGGTTSADDSDEKPAEPAPVAAPAPAVPAAPAVKAAEQDKTESDVESLTKGQLESLIASAVEKAVGEVRAEVENLRKPAPPAVAKHGVYQFPDGVENRGQAHDGLLLKSEEEVTALRRTASTAVSPAEREKAATELSKATAELLRARTATPAPHAPFRRNR
jgi:hypothetical protein